MVKAKQGEKEGSAAVKPTKMAKPLRKRRVKKTADTDSGSVVYLSRLPGFMDPQKLRALLSSQVGLVGRIYLRAESKEERYKRCNREGGSRRRKFMEGWVEFLHSSDAKKAEYLNGYSIGGKKRSLFYDDYWCFKYLKGFKWTDLTEASAAERRVRDQKLRSELAEARRDRDELLDRVEQARGIEAIKERRAEPESREQPTTKVVRTFRQHDSRPDEGEEPQQSHTISTLLGAIFPKQSSRPAPKRKASHASERFPPQEEVSARRRE